MFKEINGDTSISILIHGYYGFKNLGDELILRKVIEDLRSLYPKANLLVLSGDPLYTETTHQVKAVSRFDANEVIEAIKWCHVLILGGGGLFHDHYTLSIRDMFLNFGYGVAFYALPPLIAKIFGKPVFYWAHGVGPFFTDEAIKFTKWAYDLADFITLRDRYSYQLLLSMGIPGEKLCTDIDPTFKLNMDAFTKESIRLPDNRLIIGINLRPWKKREAEIVEEVRKVLEDIYQKNRNVLFLLIPFDISSGGSSDIRILKKLSTMLPEGSFLLIEEDDLDLETVLSVISKTHATVGMRFHFLLSALKVAKPSVALAYDRKVKELFRVLELDDLSLDLNIPDIKQVGQKLFNAIRQKERFDSIANRINCLEYKTPLKFKEFVDGKVFSTQNKSSKPESSDIYSLITDEVIKEFANIRREKNNLEFLLANIVAEKDSFWNQLNQTIAEKDSIWNQLNQTISEKDALNSQVTQVTGQLNQTIAEKDNLWNQLNQTQSVLNGIYSSHFWKVASLYYRVRDNTPILKDAFKALKILRREGVKSLGQRLRKKAKYNFSQEPLGLAKEIKYGKETKGAAPVPEADAVSCPNRYDVIFFSIINWDFRFQRPQQIATRFAKNGHRVFYLSVDLKKQASYTERPIAENVYEITLPFKENTPIYNANLKEALEITTSALEDLFKDFRIKESIAFVEFPLWHPLVEWLRGQYGAKVIFDCLDEFSGFGNVKADIEGIEETLLKSSDFCVTTSARLYEKMKDKCSDIALVRNATEFEHFHHLPPNDLLKDIKKPIIGYYGAIAEWFDTDTVEHIATQRPEWRIVLIGHTFGSDVGRLKKYKNVHLFEEMPYAQLPKYLYWFDVCIIPFKINELTLSTNPVKFYEFISSGKPVVSSKLPELLPYAEFLYLSEGKEEFLKNIEAALKENDENLIKRRVELARENDWEGRFHQIQGYIPSIFPMVSVIIVTFNNLDYTKLCIEGIYEKTAYPNLEVIVVDNASTDGTREYFSKLQTTHSDIKIIFNEENLGFAKANNMGVEVSRGEYIIFLNNDTVVTRGWISELIKYFKDPSVGMVGPVTNSIGNEAKINGDYRDLSEMEQFAERYTAKHKGVSFEISVLALYCAVLSRKAIDKVGLLDEQFLIGMFEDDDYALRLKKEGFKIICAEDVFIHHFGGATLSRLQPNEYQRIFEENKRRYEQKWGINWQPHKHR